MKAKILITMGDPSGIGPEIILKAVPQIRDEGLIPIVIGSHLVLEKAKENLGMDLVIHKTVPPFEINHRDDKGLLLYDISSLKAVRFGRPQREGALEALKYVKESVRLLQEGIGQAMVTCPVNKEVIARSGIEFKGHTELIAELCGVRDYVMMLCGPRLRVSLVTRHIALRDVPKSLTQEAILLTSRITYEALLRDFGIRGPRLALAGLNPHAGEGNLFGDEEKKILSPALRYLKEEGIPIEGPFSPDTIFYRAYEGEFDAVVALYHDQGLIPLKLVHFDQGVNVTLGLPIIRTSVDHGTAYDIAGKGIANPKSLIEATKLAYTISQNRNRVTNGAFSHPDKRSKTA